MESISSILEFRDEQSSAEAIDLHLAPTGQSEHVVHFYEEESSLVETVAQFLTEGLRNGESVIVIATEAHRQAIEGQLSLRDLPVPALIAAGLYTVLDATEALDSFMEEGMPNRDRFSERIGSLLRSKTASGKGVRAFGEMVALLCGEGKPEAAIELEGLWNELGEKLSFTLFCAYPMNGFRHEGADQPFAHICKAHSRVIPAESYYREGSTDDQRLRMVTALQQKAATLEAEIEIRKRCQADLSRRERDLRDFLENATEGIHQVAGDGKILWANRAEVELLGYEPREFIGRQISDFHADAEVIGDILSRLKRGEKLHDYEARLRHKDGSLRYVSINSSGRWEGEEFLYTRCFTRDITARKAASDVLERTVKERTAQLQEMVTELESFSYSISHDMRSPLRAIQAYATSLLEDYSDQRLDQEAVDRLNRIQRAAIRMDSLIRDVLAYSSVAKSEVRLDTVNLKSLVRDIIDQQFRAAADQIVVGELHSVNGHEAYVRQCLSNLIENALKFVRPGSTPLVRIESQLKDGAVRVSVVDNGIGIKPEHRERIFKIFGRVYSEKEYAGTGIGLVIVQKAVSRMGGVMGVESEPGKGSTFWFALPVPAKSST